MDARAYNTCGAQGRLGAQGRQFVTDTCDVTFVQPLYTTAGDPGRTSISCTTAPHYSVATLYLHVGHFVLHTTRILMAITLASDKLLTQNLAVMAEIGPGHY
jgi:hypothetical protein